MGGGGCVARPLANLHHCEISVIFRYDSMGAHRYKENTVELLMARSQLIRTPASNTWLPRAQFVSSCRRTRRVHKTRTVRVGGAGTEISAPASRLSVRASITAQKTAVRNHMVLDQQNEQ